MIKPICNLNNTNNNKHLLMVAVSRILNKNNKKDIIEEMKQRVYASNTYEDALMVVGNYVKIV